MRRSFQWELTLFTALVSGVILSCFLGVGWWLMQRQFERSVDGKMEIPGERLVGILGPDADFLELLVEYSDRSAQHEFHVLVLENDGDHWYTTPGAEWIETLDYRPFLPDPVLLASIPDPSERPPRRGGPPMGPRGERRGPPGMREGGRVRRPIAPMVFVPHTRSDGSEWRLGGISNRDVTVIMALNLADFDDEWQRVRRGYLMAIPVAFIALMGGGWLVSQRAIRPLRRVSRTASRWSVSDLSHRIEASGKEPAEFGELIEVLNEMMERLERGFTQARRFAADASHELKTPISLVQAGVEEALGQCRADNQDPAVLMGVSEEVRRLKGILDGLLLLSRADAGQLQIGNDRVDLSAEVALFCEDAEVLGKERGVECVFDVDPKIGVIGDQILMGQVIQNLVSNAIKYNVDGGKLWVSLCREGAWSIVEVGNTGTGIPEAEAERIFDRFYRVDKARSRAVDGIGLGLNIAYEIVRAHRGDLILVQADSNATVFQVRLPWVGLSTT